MSRQINQKTEDVDVKALYYGCEDAKPRDINWMEGYGETWEVIQPYSYEDFEKIEEAEEDAEEKTGYYDYDNMQDSNTPMMNYYYPLPSSSHDDYDEEDAKAISDICLCLVHFIESDEYALALTGGGMDLSWQIAEAHIRLGYLPPLHFAQLPKFGGSKKDARKTVIIDAFLKMMDGAEYKLKRDAERLRNLYE